MAYQAVLIARERQMNAALADRGVVIKLEERELGVPVDFSFVIDIDATERVVGIELLKPLFRTRLRPSPSIFTSGLEVTYDTTVDCMYVYLVPRSGRKRPLRQVQINGALLTDERREQFGGLQLEVDLPTGRGIVAALNLGGVSG